MFVGLSASLVLNSTLATYILIKKIKSTAAFYYFLFMVAVVMHVAGDLFFQLSTTPEMALPWINLYWIGFIALATLFFLFVSNFPRTRNIIFQDEKSKLVVLIIPLILIYLLLFSNDFVKSITISETGVNAVEYGSIYWLAVLHLIVFLGVAFFSLISEYFKSNSESEKRNIGLVFLGVFIASIIGLPSDVFILKALGFGDLKITSILIFFGCAIISYVVVRHKIFIIKPESEDNSATKLIFSTEGGKVYSFEERNESRRRAFRLFSDSVKHNRQGILISTIYPKRIRNNYNLQKTPILWLSESDEEYEGKINPKELDALGQSLDLFLEKANNPILLFEGIKLLVIENGATKVVELLKSLSSKAKETNATIFFSLRGEEVDFFELFNEVNSLKSSLADLNKKFYSRTIGETAYLELLIDIETKIVEKEAEFKVMEDFLLGKISTISNADRKKLLIEKSIQLVNYKTAKRTLDERIAEQLKTSLQKKLVNIEQEFNKKNLVEKY
jgi:hypothetical protein